VLTIAFGAIIGLYDIMYDTVLSAIMSICFLSIGGISGIIAGWVYFKEFDDTHH